MACHWRQQVQKNRLHRNTPAAQEHDAVFQAGVVFMQHQPGEFKNVFGRNLLDDRHDCHAFMRVAVRQHEAGNDLVLDRFRQQQRALLVPVVGFQGGVLGRVPIHPVVVLALRPRLGTGRATTQAFRFSFAPRIRAHVTSPARFIARFLPMSAVPVDAGALLLHRIFAFPLRPARIIMQGLIRGGRNAACTWAWAQRQSFFNSIRVTTKHCCS